MPATKGDPVRFSLLTVVVWLAVAAGSIFLLWQVITRLSSNNMPVSTATPNLTQVNQTIAAVMNAQYTKAAAVPAETKTPSPTSRPTLAAFTPAASPMMTSTPGELSQTATPAPLCDRAAAGNPLDLSIPDDSEMEPGESYTKVWKLVNTGTCTWTTSYSASFFYGDQMEAPVAVPLQESVAPGQSTEISVEMVAPLVPGTYQGNWKLSNPGGTLFGIGPNGDAPFWVRIIVEEIQADTPAPTEGATPTVNPTGVFTPTATPLGEASGKLAPVEGDSIDLDNIALNNGENDLTYQVDIDQFHWLSSQGEALIGIYGNQEPSQADCQSAAMSSAPIAVESMSVGTYQCYTTEEGRLGRALLMGVSPDYSILTLYLLTWGQR